jgi:hypothetical protein
MSLPRLPGSAVNIVGIVLADGGVASIADKNPLLRIVYLDAIQHFCEVLAAIAGFNSHPSHKPTYSPTHLPYKAL